MNQTIDLLSISDGKKYKIGDKVKADAMGCEGCFACCHDVGNLVTLTPKDIWEMRRALNLDSESLFQSYVELKVEHKLPIPYLKMKPSNQNCVFLNDVEECSIHANRPDICRLFPLARVYEGDDYYYILQKNACVKPKLEYVSVSKWLGIEAYPDHKAFILSWHNLLTALRFRLKFVRDDKTLNELNRIFMESFYYIPLTLEGDFYSYFNMNLKKNKDKLGIL